ncbi:predicted protein [Nematostella vectensis]|uniref:HTH psq-type domain-containing protein n=1 Tax=Nematostella vectensis TaxID=45351 RepID=A7SHF0_NEMVE|nr:predicted protein [Nematostella vectensis]|eukprot:XP_001628942.1 predicted protein [Nematostella vectensis]
MEVNLCPSYSFGQASCSIDSEIESAFNREETLEVVELGLDQCVAVVCCEDGETEYTTVTSEIKSNFPQRTDDRESSLTQYDSPKIDEDSKSESPPKRDHQQSPSTMSIKKFKLWSEEQMRMAIEHVLNGMKIRAAAEKFKVPRSTLGDRLLMAKYGCRKLGVKRYTQQHKPGLAVEEDKYDGNIERTSASVEQTLKNEPLLVPKPSFFSNGSIDSPLQTSKNTGDDRTSTPNDPETSSSGPNKPHLIKLIHETSLMPLQQSDASCLERNAKAPITVDNLMKRKAQEVNDSPDVPKRIRLWKGDDMKAAIHAVTKNGMAVRTAAKAYGIPRTTLKQYICKNKQESQSALTLKKWSEEKMEQALVAIKTEDMPIRVAARKFQIPKSTLYDRVNRGDESIDQKIVGVKLEHKDEELRSNNKSAKQVANNSENNMEKENINMHSSAIDSKISEKVKDYISDESLTDLDNSQNKSSVTVHGDLNMSDNLLAVSPPPSKEAEPKSVHGEQLSDNFREGSLGDDSHKTVKEKCPNYITPAQHSKNDNHSPSFGTSSAAICNLQGSITADSPCSLSVPSLPLVHNELPVISSVFSLSKLNMHKEPGNEPAENKDFIQLTFKGERKRWTEFLMQKAVNEVLNGSCIRVAASKYGVPRSTLGDRVLTTRRNKCLPKKKVNIKAVVIKEEPNPSKIESTNQLGGRMSSEASCDKSSPGEHTGNKSPDLTSHTICSPCEFNDDKRDAMTGNSTCFTDGYNGDKCKDTTSDSSCSWDSGNNTCFQEESRKSGQLKKKLKKWSEENMERAIDAVERGMPVRLASKQFHIPRTTLTCRRLRRENRKVLGPSPHLTREDEDRLISFINHCVSFGFKNYNKVTRMLAGEAAYWYGTWNLTLNGLPSEEWWDAFCHKNKHSLQKAVLAKSPVDPSQTEIDLCINSFFNKFHTVLEGSEFHKTSLVDCAEHIFTVCESKFDVHLMCAGSSDNFVPKLPSCDRFVSTICCVSASGTSMPPMFIYHSVDGKQAMNAKGPAGSIHFDHKVYDFSRQGIDFYFPWFKDIFLKNAPNVRPLVLLVDPNMAFITPELIKLAHENRVILLCLPELFTHIVQPISLTVLPALRGGFLFSPSCPKDVTFGNFSECFSSAWSFSVNSSLIKEGFKQAGICPYKKKK